MWTCPKCGEKNENKFDVCLKCVTQGVDTPRPQLQPWTLKFFGFAVVAALLAPILADCLHSLLVVGRGIRFYQAELGAAAYDFWGSVVVRAVVTFCFLVLLVRLRLPDWLIWVGFVALWFWLNLEREVVFK
jgi:hypothetical protein